MPPSWSILFLIAVLLPHRISPQYQGLQQSSSSGGCPERNGRFADPRQCDAYTECIDGIATPKLCPDGLLFSEKALFTYPCLYPPEVDCQGRTALQPAQPTELCPHQFGYYLMGDANNCGHFVHCANGIAYMFECPEGLAFSEERLICDWPDLVPSCNAEAYLGFTCPNKEITAFGASGYTFFRSPATCQKYFLCIEGRPRMFNCREGYAFDEVTSSCEAAENVTGCALPVQPHNQFRPQGLDGQQNFNSQRQPSYFSG